VACKGDFMFAFVPGQTLGGEQ